MKHLSQLCSCISDQCDPARSNTSVYVGLEHIDTGGFFLARHGNPSEVHSAKSRFKKGDILYGKLRPYLDKAVIAPFDGISSTDILVFRPESDVCGAYLLGLIHTPEFIAHAAQTTNGVNHPRTSWRGLSEFPWDVPPKSEQEKIAAVLWKTQQAIEAEEKLISAACTLKQSAMSHLFTSGLHSEPQKETEIGLIPQSWEIDSIGNRCEKPEYGLTASAKFDGTGPQFLRITDITESGVMWKTVPFCDCSANDEEEKRLRDNDILFARIGATTGKSHIVKSPPRAVFASYLIRVRPKSGLDANYLYYFFNTQAYWKQVNANKDNSLKGGVNGSILATMLFPVPKHDEQQEIAKLLQTIDGKISVHREKHAALQELFNTFLHELMTGEIRVANLDLDVSKIQS